MQTFHQLPERSSPPACLENTSAGILCWAKYMETIKATKCYSTEKMTIACKFGDCCMAPDPVSGFENNLMNVLRPRLDLDLLTRADAPIGISIVAP